MGGLEFTEQAARQLERLLLTRDLVAQRSETIKQLALSHGERVLDIGCGPGFLFESMAEIVGRDGAVIGIDISSNLVASCKRRSPPKWLSHEVGDATQLAQPDASFDSVLQKLDYTPSLWHSDRIRNSCRCAKDPKKAPRGQHTKRTTSTETAVRPTDVLGRQKRSVTGPEFLSKVRWQTACSQTVLA
jgi:SAM-dependent methyltransferase